MQDLLKIRSEVPDRIPGISKGSRLQSSDTIREDREPEDAPARSFADVYRDVADANRNAERSCAKEDDAKAEVRTDAQDDQDTQDAQVYVADEQSVEDSSSPLMPAGNSAEASEVTLPVDGTSGEVASSDAPDDASESPVDAAVLVDALLSSISGEQVPAVVSGAPQTVAEQASTIIQNALTTISQTLNLDLTKELDGLDIRQASSGIVDQFADIVAALKQIAGMLVKAADQNQPVEIKGQVFDSAKAVQAEQVLRVEIFHIEIAMKMLGTSGQLASDIAQKMDMPFSNGVPMAADLQKVEMPASGIKDIFSKLISVTEDEVKSVVARIKALAEAQQNSSSDGADVVTPFSARLIRKPLTDLSQYDSLTFRKMLKIDSPAAASEKPAPTETAAEDDGISKTLKLSVDNLLLKNARAKLEGDILPVNAAAGKNPGSDAMAAALMNKTAGVPTRGFEDGIMSQIVEKMHIAVRTGASEMKLVLHPKSLGEVQIKVQVHEDVVMAKINVESQQVKQIVETHLQTLKDALAQHNLQSGGIEVSVGNGSRQDGERTEETVRRQFASNRTHTAGDENEIDPKTVSIGTDTGRLYGDNSIEYYA
jgi:flagellar hook-length control protein FliK